MKFLSTIIGLLLAWLVAIIFMLCHYGKVEETDPVFLGTVKSVDYTAGSFCSEGLTVIKTDSISIAISGPRSVEFGDLVFDCGPAPSSGRIYKIGDKKIRGE